MNPANTISDSLTAIRRAAMAAPMLDAKTERDLLRAYRRDGSSAALGRLIASHLRLVLAIARKFGGQGIAMEDLVSEGNLGLVHAAMRFDLGRVTRFATYSAWWIRAYIRRYTLTNRRIVALPSTRSARRILGGLRKTERELTQIHGEPASREHVAKSLGVSTEDMSMMEGALRGRDVPVGPLCDSGGYEPIAEDPSPEDHAAESEAASQKMRAIRHAVDNLGAREREIIQRRMLATDGETLASLGSSLGLSRERVRQLECGARATLKKALVDLVAPA